MADVKQWLITVSHDQSIRQVVSCLSERGFVIRDVLEAVGCITGSADDATADQLKTIKGIEDFAPDSQIDLGLPEIEEHW